MKRRTFLTLAGIGATHLFSGAQMFGCSTTDAGPGPVTLGPPRGDPLFLGGLTTGITEEHNYLAAVDGVIPSSLRGALYRNGPGLFERDGVRRACVVDGDGMISAYYFSDEGVRFKNRYTQTEKWLEEEKAGKFLYDSWTTKITDTPLPTIRTQAGVSARVWRDRLFAFDEGSFPYELDPVTLDTLGTDGFGRDSFDTTYAAHPKHLAETGEWAHFGVSYSSGQVSVTILKPDGGIAETMSYKLAPISYVHDFFVTAKHVIIHAHPAVLDLATLLEGNSVRESLQWRPEDGSKFLVFKRGSQDAPQIFETEAAWMWHTANAWDQDGEIVLEYIAYPDASNFLGDASQLCTIMDGTITEARKPGELRRARLTLATSKMAVELLASHGNLEFPGIHPAKVGQKSRYTYSVSLGGPATLFSGVSRFDGETGQLTTYDFGPTGLAGEPIVVPRPGETAEDAVWLLSEVWNTAGSENALAIFRGDALADGPVAMVRLTHHLPIRFHGEWMAG